MSYILDALKKAESERKMGGVPDLHAQPLSNLSQQEKSAAWSRLVVVGTALLLAAGVIALAWIKPWQATSGSPVQAAAQAPQAVSTPTTPIEPKPAIAQAPAPAPAPSATTATPPPMPAPPMAAVEQQPKPLAAVAKPVVEHKPPPKQAEPAPIRPAAPVSAAAAPPAKQAPATAPAAAAEARIPEFGELPEAVRREIPAFAFGGYLYASTPADRTVLVNNRLLHEGDQIAPGLTLERMMPKEAVLNYLGYRYRVAY